MRRKDIGFIIMAIIFLVVVGAGLFDESIWILSTGVFFGILIFTGLSYASRSLFRTKKSYFYPLIAGAIIGAIFFTMGLIDNSEWGAIAYILFGLYFIGSALFTLPTYYIFDDRFMEKEKTD